MPEIWVNTDKTETFSRNVFDFLLIDDKSKGQNFCFVPMMRKICTITMKFSNHHDSICKFSISISILMLLTIDRKWNERNAAKAKGWWWDVANSIQQNILDSQHANKSNEHIYRIFGTICQTHTPQIKQKYTHVPISKLFMQMLQKSMFD